MIKTWLGKQFESSCEITPEFVTFAKCLKAYIKRNLPEGAELMKCNRGHFYLYGFIKNGDKFAYFSTSDVRHFQDSWYNNMLIRTAQGEKDFTGGVNRYTSLDNFTQAIESLIA